MSLYFRKARDPLSSLTHLIGAVLFSLGTVFLVWKGIVNQSGAVALVSAAVFGLSLVGLYSASALYHFARFSERAILALRKLDHSMIYVLIAGSYTPLLLCCFPRPKAYLLTIAIWAIAAVGILAKLLWFQAPRLLYTGFYIAMGWFILLDLPALAVLEPPAILLLAAGGVCYTVGGVIYGLKRPNLSSAFGHHELFHLFVLAGSLCHYSMVLCYLV